jgi:hypothetical protein
MYGDNWGTNPGYAGFFKKATGYDQSGYSDMVRRMQDTIANVPDYYTRLQTQNDAERRAYFHPELLAKFNANPQRAAMHPELAAALGWHAPAATPAPVDPRIAQQAAADTASVNQFRANNPWGTHIMDSGYKPPGYDSWAAAQAALPAPTPAPAPNSNAIPLHSILRGRNRLSRDPSGMIVPEY